MGNFGQKVDKFMEIFLEQNGYVKVVEGLQNTLLIAVTGLVIGILIGTIIATVRVAAQDLKRNLWLLCGFVQGNTDGSAAAGILLCTASDPWLADYRCPGSYAGVRTKQWRLHIRDHAEWNPVCRSRSDGSRKSCGIKLWNQHDKDRDSTGS